MSKCTVKAFGYNRKCKRISGFSLLEIVIALAIVGFIGINIMMLQTSSWKRTNTSNRLLVSGQMIEKKIEYFRMNIDADPLNNFPPIDGSTSENGINLSWQFSSAYRPLGPQPRGPLTNVRRCDFTATWGTSRGDTLIVTTYLSKFF